MVTPRKSERQHGAMPTIQVRNVAEEAHQVLRRQAAEANQSLPEYLRSRLIADANQPTAVAELISGPSVSHVIP